MTEKEAFEFAMIPNNFDNYKQRELLRGLETSSETEYRGYIIWLRCYRMSGIKGRIIKVTEFNKRIKLRERAYNFKKPIDLLNELKNYIDNYEINLINRLKEKHP
jgi:hypothetical protein